MNGAALERDIRAYLERTGMSVHGFGRLAMNDPGFVTRLTGRSVRAATEARARRFMADNPDGVLAGKRLRDRGVTTVRSGLGYVRDDNATVDPVGPAPFPPIVRVAEDHGDLAVRIARYAAVQGRSVSEVLSELVAIGWRAVEERRAA